MITRSSIAFEDFLGSSIAPQVMPPCLNVNVFIMIDIFDNIILATLIVRKNIDRRWQNKIPMRLSLRSISCENTIQLRNTKEFFAPIRYNALSHILKQIIYTDVFTKKKYVAKSGREAEGRIQGFLHDDVPYKLKISKSPFLDHTFTYDSRHVNDNVIPYKVLFIM